MNNNQKLREALENSSGLLKDLAPFGEWYESAWEQVKENSAALAAPPRNCDMFKSEYDADKLHEAFVKYCNACDCPMGCIHKRDTRCMLDTRCGSILKCFAKFVLSEQQNKRRKQ